MYMETKTLLRLFLFWLLAVIFVLPLSAQTGGQAFTPNVSELRGELRNNLIRLTWVDSFNVRGPVFIYRSTLPFDGQGPFPGIRPIEVPYGAQTYVDEFQHPDVPDGMLHYFIASSDVTGRRFETPIAGVNTLSMRVSEGRSVTLGSEPVQGQNPAPSLTGAVPRSTAGISSLEARVQGERVIITFNQGNVRNPALYRSTRPINNTSDLLGALIIQTRISSPFTDVPVPGIPYFYAVIDEEDLVRGTIEIRPGRNATLLPVEVAAAGREGASRELRAMPLPQISVQTAIPGTSHFSAPPVTELSLEALRALEGFPVRQSSPALRRPRAFSRDLDPASGLGEDRALALIVSGPFAARNWQAAQEELTRFLALPRSPETQARARFYLGQCFYFLDLHRESLFEFLAIQNRFPTEAYEWIQASLIKMTN